MFRQRPSGPSSSMPSYRRLFTGPLPLRRSCHRQARPWRQGAVRRSTWKPSRTLPSLHPTKLDSTRLATLAIVLNFPIAAPPDGPLLAGVNYSEDSIVPCSAAVPVVVSSQLHLRPVAIADSVCLRSNWKSFVSLAPVLPIVPIREASRWLERHLVRWNSKTDRYDVVLKRRLASSTARARNLVDLLSPAHEPTSGSVGCRPI